MKRLLFLLLLISTVHASAQKVTDESATEKFVLKLHEAKFRWMVNKRLDSLNNLLDERVQYVHSKVTEAKARVYKGFVVINGKGIFSVIMDGKPLDISLLYTEVYAKRQNGWLLVSRHANKLQ
jgi:hypothetical protein